MRKTLLTSALLAATTFVMLGVAKAYLPYSTIKDAVIDALTVPGALILGIVYPQGLHTGSGAPSWPLWVIAANFLIYVAFWYVCIWLFRHAVGKDRFSSRGN
jgi:hypothetical protein